MNAHEKWLKERLDKRNLNIRMAAIIAILSWNNEGLFDNYNAIPHNRLKLL